MGNRDYEVLWNARGKDFNYCGKETVWVSSENEARERAVREGNRKMCMSRQLISIETVRVI